MLLTEYNEEKHLKNVKKTGIEEGRRLGKEEGRTLGKEEGRRLGKEEGRRLGNLLTQKLLADKRLSDLERAVQDEDYQEQLLKEYGII